MQAAARGLHPVVHSRLMKAGKPYAHLILVLAGLTSLLIHFRGRPWDATRVLGVAILVPSLALWFLARLQLGSSFSVRVQAKQLVTHGLYSKIRNPVYLFGAMGILGIILYIGHLQWLWVFALVVPLQLFRIRKEEKVLQEKFGDTFLEYKSRTWF
ncbi:MAG: isoprenylcysteine carboxylmethyltransferase family protein [Candidatus Acidiferrales bacterium]